jgi:putative redox protein
LTDDGPVPFQDANSRTRLNERKRPMSKDILEVSLRTVNDKVKFAAWSDDRPEISIDYIPPVGDGEGYTSLELLLFSFTSCVSTLLLHYLRSILKRDVVSLQAKAIGDVRSEHPKSLSRIQVALTLQSPDAEESDVKTALKAAESRLCPVWAMIKGNVEIEVTFVIEK